MLIFALIIVRRIEVLEALYRVLPLCAQDRKFLACFTAARGRQKEAGYWHRPAHREATKHNTDGVKPLDKHLESSTFWLRDVRV